MRRVYLRLYRGVGKRYDIDEDVPDSALISSLLGRSLELVRGLVRFRTMTFVGSRVHVRGRRHLHLERGATIERGCRIDALSHDGVHLGPRAKLGSGTIVSSTGHLSKVGQGLRMGRDSSCGEWCYFGASGGITIGNDVIMGQYVTFHAQQHEFDDPENPIRLQGTTEEGIEIGDGTWIGAKATFLDGARVGPGSVVAAGAVVRGAHPPGAVLAGVPARVVRQR
ncbi:MAG: hypothetical protein QOI95_3534 [Acidimicrobiaceae bacterium]